MNAEETAYYYDSLVSGLRNMAERNRAVYFKNPEDESDWTRNDMVQWFAGIERGITLYQRGHITEVNKILQKYSGNFLEGFKLGLALAQYEPSGKEPTFTFTDTADEDRKGRFVFRV